MKLEVLLVGTLLPTSSGNLSTSTVVLIDHPSGPLLVDSAAWNQRRALITELEHRALQPADVRTILFTHLHWDHCLNFDLFPHARLLVSEREWLRVAHPPVDTATPAFIREILERHAKVEVFRPGMVVEGIEATPTPGHTDGHVSFLVEAGGRIAIGGDAVATRETARTGVPPLVFGDPDDARRSVAHLLQATDVIVPGHDVPFETRRYSPVLAVHRFDLREEDQP